MQAIRNSLMEKYGLSRYQVAQLTFLAKTVASDVSKMFIMAILFHRQFTLFLFALAVMLVLRCSTGGIHFYTYFECLAGSILYLWLAVFLLQHIMLPLPLMAILCTLCAIGCFFIGPVPSRYRPPYTETFKKRCKLIIATFIMLYTLTLSIMPDSSYIIVGFWVIILHFLQLLAAKYTRKENG